jgi:hypothetical protein
MSHCRIVVMLAANIVFVGAALAQRPVGEFVEFNCNTCCGGCGEEGTALRNAPICRTDTGKEDEPCKTSQQLPQIRQPIRVGETLETHKMGRLLMNFEDRSVVELRQDSKLQILKSGPTESGFVTEVDLPDGHARVYVSKESKFTVTTPAGIVLSHGTDFFVFYNPANETTEVIGVEDEVDVFGVGHCEGRKVTLAPHQVTTVERGRCPATPWQIDDATLAYYVDAGELIGNGAAETIGLGDEIPPDAAAESNERPLVFKRETEPSCSTPACLVKPVFVPGGNLHVKF